MFAGVDHLGLFIAAGLLLNLTPGPDVLYIVSSGLRGGWRAGSVAALGITAGCLVHVAAATAGLSALVAASGTAFTVLKWLGAAYLVFIGARMLLAGRGQREPALPSAMAAQPGAPALRQVFNQAFWTNALNPKVALFFLAFLPQFITPGSAHPTLAFTLLGLLFNLNAVPINLGYALLAAWAAQRMDSVRRAMHWLERFAGALFLAFGLKLALTSTPHT